MEEKLAEEAELVADGLLADPIVTDLEELRIRAEPAEISICPLYPSAAADHIRCVYLRGRALIHKRN